MSIKKYLVIALSLSAAASTLCAQSFQRRASVINSNGPNDHKCVVEVVVDGAAEVEIRGDGAILRNLKGQPPQWRRFECTEPMPANPEGFRFHGVDGRGSQQLVQAAGDGRPAVIRIDDPDNGSEGYTFEINWGLGGGPISRGGPNYPENYPSNNPNYGQNYPPPPPPPGRPGGPRRFFADDAVSACQSFVRDQAARRFNAGDVIFRRTRLDDQPGRNDWVTGFFEARSQYGRPRNYQFSCSVDFDNGRVRSADIKPMANGMNGWAEAANGRAIQACEVSVEQRLNRDGYQRIDFGSANVDDRPGRNDWVVGTVTALERNRPIWFDFSCSVDLRAGEVRSADVTRR